MRVHRPTPGPLSREWFDATNRQARLVGLLCALAAFLIAASACRSGSGSLPEIALPAPLQAAARADDLRPMLTAPTLRGLLSAIDAAPATTGAVRLLTGPTSCRPAGGVLPYPVLPRQIPRVGQEVAITWTTRACTIPPPPPDPCWIVASFRPAAPVDFGPFGSPGCWLLVQPDQLVAVPATRPAGGMLWRDGGTVFFRWTPAPRDAGTSLLLQMIVLAPGETRSGWMVSPAVEVIVGS